MFERDHRIYYERRWAQATELGDRAANPKIAAIHYELALRYAIALVGPRAREKLAPIGTDKADAPEPARAMFSDSGELGRKRAPEVAIALRHCHSASLT